MNINTTRIALLIDCDNISHNAIGGVLAELANYGTVIIRHAHGDWNSSQQAGWRDKLHPHAIRPMQQFAYTTGKNASDIAITIDAMDIIHSGSTDAIALMTSDSDFTPLVLRVLESGLPVYGFGAKKTPEAFVNACSKFIYTENLAPNLDEPEAAQQPNGKLCRTELRKDSTLVRLLRSAVDMTTDDDGWSDLSRVGNYISNNSSFSPVNYGYKKLSDLIRVCDLFDIEMRNNGTTMFIRDKRAGKE